MRKWHAACCVRMRLVVAPAARVTLPGPSVPCVSATKELPASGWNVVKRVTWNEPSRRVSTMTAPSASVKSSASWPRRRVPTCQAWLLTSAGSSARILSSWLPRRCAPTMRWWHAPSMPGGQVCSTRPSVWMTSTRCHRALMSFTARATRATFQPCATWNN